MVMQVCFSLTIPFDNSESKFFQTAKLGFIYFCTKVSKNGHSAILSDDDKKLHYALYKNVTDHEKMLRNPCE